MNGAPNKWLITVTVMAPTAMEILDTSVANVALAHIQGALNAGLDEVTWVLTSYLVANGLVLPMTGYLATRFGRRRILLTSVIGFTAASLLCGVAPTLTWLIVCRVLQGFFGGALQPMSQAILLESWPAKDRGMAMAIYAMGIVTAPIFGPLIGGYITDHSTWRWVFFINIPVGVLSTLGILAVIHDPPYLKAQRRPFDPLGLLFLVVGIGALQILLDRGNHDDWFESNNIILLALVAGAGIITLITWELVFARAPLVDLRVFAARSFGTGTLVMFLVYSAFFASLVLLPLYLQTLMGYTALQAGWVLGPGGMATVVLLPVVGQLLRRGYARPVLFCGLVAAAVALHMMAGLNLQADFRAVLIPRIVQGVGLACFFVPLITLTMTDITPEKTGNATGLFALMRNLGGAIGVAVSSTILANRMQTHRQRLIEELLRPRVASTVGGLTATLEQKGLPDPHSAAFALFNAQVNQQASMLAFNDGFHLLFVIMVCVTPLIFLFPRQKSQGGVPTEI